MRLVSLAAVALAAGLSACTVDTLATETRPAVANSCKDNSDCGLNGVCTNGACYSKSGTIDEVLLEIAPEATSPFGSSFLSMQSSLRRVDRARNIALAGPVTFQAQVQVNGEDLPIPCPYLHTGKQTVAARIQFVRTGSLGGVPVSGLSSNFTVTVDTEQSTSGFSKNVALVPGFYDIYAQPVASPNCQIASKLWRGVDVGRDGQVVGWAPPATLELPTPRRLNGVVQRKGGTLADWQVDILDSQDARVVSTSARLGATTDAAPVTNFEISFQPLEYVVSTRTSNLISEPGPSGLLIRLKPPKDAEATVPTLYFDLDAAAGTGQANLDVSDLPTPAQLVTVSGQVRGPNNEAVRATVKFVNSTLRIVFGLPAAFGPAVTTDGAGRYTTKLFPGVYRVILIPEGATDNGTAVQGANPTRAWALTTSRETIGLDATQVLDLAVEPVRTIEGVASAGRTGAVAQGATLEAAPFVDTSSDVFRTVVSPPVSPARASVPVNDTTGKFSLVLDPGDYDLSLKPAAESNFAWWILPRFNVDSSDIPVTVNPQLLYPIRLEGIITVAMQDKTSQPLRNATVQAYARTPEGDVTKVGIARTDDMGRYYVALPPGFGSP